ncbi:MAG: serine/threonine protein phosphatase PrpC [Candidatus Azotimanducaceae bacterium]
MHNEKNISRQFSWHQESFTDVGKVRKVNEDSYTSVPEQAHWAVADGMGGHTAGDVASQAVTKALGDITRGDEFTEFVDQVEDSLSQVNADLRKITEGDDDVCGSTVVGMCLQGNHLVYYWAGDSRLYRFRRGALEMLSIDHTYLQELIDEGSLKPSEALDHPDKSVITRAVGADEELYVDFEMDVLFDQDIYMLCSDGVEKKVTDEEVEEILRKHGNKLKAAGQEIIDTVLDRGAPDNVTLILIEVIEA